MLATTFTTIAPFLMILLREHNKSLLREIIVLLIQLITLGKTLKFFTHGDAKIS
jgi:hypothetical protein